MTTPETTCSSIPEQLMLSKISLCVTSDLHNLATVLSWFEELKPGLDDTSWLQCRIALAEGFTNAVRHAHRGLSVETPILLEAQVDSSGLVLEIWDQGQPFDLAKHFSDLPPSSRDAEGGRGLRLIHEVADQVDYRRFHGDSNCLRIVKQLQLSPAVAS